MARYRVTWTIVRFIIGILEGYSRFPVSFSSVFSGRLTIVVPVCGENIVSLNFQSVIVICCNFVNIGNTVIFVISVWLFVIFLLLFVAGILRKEKNCNSLLFYFAKISCLRNYSMIVCNFCHVFVIIPWLFIILVIISVFVIISKLFIIFILLFIVVNLWFVVILFWKKEMHFIFERKYVAWWCFRIIISKI